MALLRAALNLATATLLVCGVPQLASRAAAPPSSQSGARSIQATIGNQTNSHTWIGIINAQADTQALHIKHVYSASPGSVAGLRTGDQIIKIEGRSFADQKQFNSILAGVTGVTYTLTIMRAGHPQEIIVERASEPPTGTPAADILDAETQAFLNGLDARATERQQK